MSLLDSGQTVNYALGAGRGAWLHVACGEVSVNGQKMGTGDGAGIEDEGVIRVTAMGDGELMLFDLA